MRGLTMQHRLRSLYFPQHVAARAVRPRQYRAFASRGTDSVNALPAAELNNNITQEEKNHFAQKLANDKSEQYRTPWHWEGNDQPPVSRQRSASVMTKGKLLTTPSRMLKIILPLNTHNHNSDHKDMEPLALLVHPQQPISYLERLIQAELPTLKDKDGRERMPNVYFRAEDSLQDSTEPPPGTDVPRGKEGDQDFDKVDKMRIDGKTEKTGKLHSGSKDRKTREEAAELRGGHGKGGVESYSGQGQEGLATKLEDRKFVRWSSSTEIGDFIRDAARGQEFAIEIEGAPEEVYVGVPSFDERTFYLRMRLRKTASQISKMADIKEECDHLAQRAAKNVARAGFGGIVTWWGVVYYLTFQTSLGWDVMEPVTYLVGLSTLIGGYVWFLYHNREVSYQSAMKFTISRRQQALYHQHKFDVRKWENLIEDGNALRREIKLVANEYDVDWDELQEEKDEKVAEALKNERKTSRDEKKEEIEKEEAEEEKQDKK